MEKIVSKCCKAEILITKKGNTICSVCNKKLYFNTILERYPDPYEKLF